MLNLGGLPPGEAEGSGRALGCPRLTQTTQRSPAAGHWKILALHRDLELFLLCSCSCWKSCSSEFQVYLIILLISHKGTSFLGGLLIVVQILFNRCILQLFYFFGFPIPCLTFHFPLCFLFPPVHFIVNVFPLLNLVSFLFICFKSFIASTHSNISFHC